MFWVAWSQNRYIFYEIVYYTTREVKSWLVQSTCKLPPEPKARVTNMCSGVSLVTPMLRILFFNIPGPKIPHSRFWAGSESGTFGQGMAKNSIRSTGVKLASSPSARVAIDTRYGLSKFFPPQVRNILLLSSRKFYFWTANFTFDPKMLFSTRKSDLREIYTTFAPIFGGERWPLWSGVE